jgi:hypothetical protein
MAETAQPVGYRKDIVLAKEVTATEAGLTIVTGAGRFFLRWEECSQTLAKASDLERRGLRMSPSGYGIHWPLIDEDLAVGPLVEGRKPIA